MLDKLGQKEKRTLKIGAVCAAAILMVGLASKWLEHWSQVRKSLSQIKVKLEAVSVDEAKRAGLLSIVPAFEMPQAEEEQKLLFRDKFNEQLRSLRIKSEPLQVLPAGKSRQLGYKLLRLKCSAKCKFGQVLDLLAGLKQNPYLVGIEEIKIQCDLKKPQEKREEIELELTVSTFVR